jgi:hypothetical protein
MSRLFVALCAASVLVLAGCESENLCGLSPLCRDGQAINCDPSCTVGPCSNSPTFQDCPADTTTCVVALGDPSSTRFFRSRAVCQVTGSASCDPAVAGPPVCDGLGSVEGCSAYGEVIHASCESASTFFEDAACCSGPLDGGTDAGTDAGTDGGVDAGVDAGV